MGLKQNDTGRVPMPFVKCLLMNLPRDFFYLSKLWGTVHIRQTFLYE